MSITPSASQVEQLLAGPADEPVTMLNLLRFKPEADGVDAGVSGREAYLRYARETAPFLEKVGGRMLAALEASQMVIGPQELEWDMVLLVEYPSRRRFIEMATDPAYLEVHAHRAAALADSRLIACVPARLDAGADAAAQALGSAG